MNGKFKYGCVFFLSLFGYLFKKNVKYFVYFALFVSKKMYILFLFFKLNIY